jgi:predicted nucleotidyltransferase
MGIKKELYNEIERVGIKEIARRSGLSPSTVSRVNSKSMNPSFDIIEKISKAAGFKIEIMPEMVQVLAPRLSHAEDVLLRLRKELKSVGVRHVIIFGSTARGEDKDKSDIDIYLDFAEKPKTSNLLKAEGRIIEAFGENKVDIVSWLESEKGRRLMIQIEKDGVRVF